MQKFRIYACEKLIRGVSMFEDFKENNIEDELDKLIQQAKEIKEINDLYISFMKQRLLNSYSVN